MRDEPLDCRETYTVFSSRGGSRGAGEASPSYRQYKLDKANRAATVARQRGASSRSARGEDDEEEEKNGRQSHRGETGKDGSAWWADNEPSMFPRRNEIVEPGQESRD